MLNRTHSPPAGKTKRGAPPPHPREGPGQSEARTPDKTARKNNQTYKNSLYAHRAAKARKAGSKLSDKRDADAKNKKGPRQKERRRRNKKTHRPNTRSARRRQKSIIYIYLFSFLLRKNPYPVRKIRTVSHRHKTTKLSEAPETLYLWAFSAVSRL